MRCQAPRFHCAVSRSDGTEMVIAGLNAGCGCVGRISPGRIAATASSQVCSECSRTRCRVVLRPLDANSWMKAFAVAALEARSKGGSDGLGGGGCGSEA